MLILLGEVQQQGLGQFVGGLVATIRDYLQGVPQAEAYLRQLAEANLQAESESTRAFGRGLQALLAGERDPERLLAGWGQDAPLLAAALRLALEEE